MVGRKKEKEFTGEHSYSHTVLRDAFKTYMTNTAKLHETTVDGYLNAFHALVEDREELRTDSLCITTIPATKLVLEHATSFYEELRQTNRYSPMLRKWKEFLGYHLRQLEEGASKRGGSRASSSAAPASSSSTQSIAAAAAAKNARQPAPAQVCPLSSDTHKRRRDQQRDGGGGEQDHQEQQPQPKAKRPRSSRSSAASESDREAAWEEREEELTQANQELTQFNEELVEKCNKRARRITELKKALKKAEDKAEKQERRALSAEETVAKLRHELTIAAARNPPGSADNDKFKWSLEFGRVNRDLGRTEAERDRLQAQCQSVEADRDRLQARVQCLEAEGHRMQAERQCLREELASFRCARHQPMVDPSAVAPPRQEVGSSKVAEPSRACHVASRLERGSEVERDVSRADRGGREHRGSGEEKKDQSREGAAQAVGIAASTSTTVNAANTTPKPQQREGSDDARSLPEHRERAQPSSGAASLHLVKQDCASTSEPGRSSNRDEREAKVASASIAHAPHKRDTSLTSGLLQPT